MVNTCIHRVNDVFGVEFLFLSVLCCQRARMRSRLMRDYEFRPRLQRARHFHVSR